MSRYDLTVIVPAYNAEKTIDRCLNSIINQTHKNLKIVVVDDCSTDSTPGILKNYKSKYKNIEIITNEKNMELGCTRNIALKYVTTEYVTFVDSDDWVDLDAYQRCINRIRETDADLAIFGIRNEYENKMLSQIRYCYIDNYITGELALNLLCNTFAMDMAISPIVNNKIYSTSLLMKNDINFGEYPFYEDMPFSYNILKRAQKVALVDRVFYHYYQNPTSKTHVITNTQINYFCFSMQQLYNSVDLSDNKETMLYYSFLDKSVSALVGRIDEFVLDSQDKKTFVVQLIKGLKEFVNLSELLNYIDARRIIAAIRGI